MADELLDHFEDKFKAQSRTQTKEMEEGSEKSGIFTLEFEKSGRVHVSPSVMKSVTLMAKYIV